MEITRRYEINPWKNNCITIKTTQGEGGIKLAEFILTDDNGAINLKDATKITFNGEKQDGTAFCVDCKVENASNGIISVTEVTGMTDVAGNVKGTIDVITARGNIKFDGITLYVAPNPVDELIKASNAFSGLVNLANKYAAIDNFGAIAVDDELSGSSPNPVQNKVIKQIVQALESSCVVADSKGEVSITPSETTSLALHVAVAEDWFYDVGYVSTLPIRMKQISAFNAEIAHTGALIWNLTARELVVSSYSELPSLTYDYVVLFANFGGKPIGQWAKYYHYYVFNAGGTTIIGSPSGSYSGTVQSFGALSPTKNYILWKNAVNAFDDIEIGSNLNFDKSGIQWMYVNPCIARTAAKYSSTTMGQPVLVFISIGGVLSPYMAVYSGDAALKKLIIQTDMGSYNINNFFNIDGTTTIGSSSGTYSGSVQSFGELSPTKSYLLWRNALETFDDVSEELRDSYIYIHPCGAIAKKTYSDIGYIIPVFVFKGINCKVYKCLWNRSSGGLIVSECLSVTSDWTDTQAPISAKMIDDRFNALPTNGDSTERYLIAPNGSKYLTGVANDGTLFSIPVVPRKVVYIGNSLLIGFTADSTNNTDGAAQDMSKTMGMAATASTEDYYCRLQMAFGNPTSKKIRGVNYETSASVSNSNTWINTKLPPMLSGYSDADLVLIQLGDNVSTDGMNDSDSADSKGAFAKTFAAFINKIRENCPVARIVFCGSWYKGDTFNSKYQELCVKSNIQFIDFSGVRNQVNTAAYYGMTYKLPENRTVTYSNLNSYSVNPTAQTITLNFTVGNTTYTPIISYAGGSYSPDSNTSVTVVSSNQCIATQVNANGIVTHPSDHGFELIAEIMLKELGVA